METIIFIKETKSYFLESTLFKTCIRYSS